MIELSIFLYGKPSWDLEIEGKNNIDPKIFRDHATYLKEHLESVTDTLEKLQSNGWEVSGALYSLMAYKSTVKTKKDAKKELKMLSIDPESIDIEEF